MGVLPKLFVVETGTEAAVLAANEAANAAGGGIILLPDAIIPLSAPLPAYDHVHFIGVQPKFTLSLIPDNIPSAITGGTWFVGDGAFVGVAGNNVPADTALTQAQGYADSALKSFSLHNIGLDNFSRGLDLGAKNVMGLVYGSLTNLYIRNCAEWGVSLLNVMHTPIDNIFVWAKANTPGSHVGRIVSDQPIASLIPGNFMATRLFGYQGNPLGRGWVFEATAGSILNEVRAERVQCNRFGLTVVAPQAATMSNGSPSIGVTDGTKFAVGLPVVFDATANGFTATQTYMVLSVVGNTITVGNQKSGAAVSATGSTAVNVRSNGMPNVEVVAGSSGGILHSALLHLDLEGYSTAQLYTENVGNCQFDIFELNTNNGLSSIVSRNCVYSEFRSRKEAIIDFDGSSNSSHMFGSVSTIRQRKPIGLYQKSDQARSWLVLAGGLAGANPDFAPVSLSGGAIIQPYTALGTKTNANQNVAINLDAGRAGIIAFNGASPVTWTLPTITNANVQTSMLGLTFEIANTGTATLTVNTDGTQLFNGQAGKTSIAVAAGQSVKLVAIQTGGSTALHWATFLSAPLP